MVVAYNCVAYNCRSPIIVFFPVPVPPPYVLCVIEIAYNCVFYNCKIACNCILFVPLTQKISYNCIFLMKLVLKVNFSRSVYGCHFENLFLTPKRSHSLTFRVKSRVAFSFLSDSDGKYNNSCKHHSNLLPNQLPN